MKKKKRNDQQNKEKHLSEIKEDTNNF
jgi:hypothetical protein